MGLGVMMGVGEGCTGLKVWRRHSGIARVSSDADSLLRGVWGFGRHVFAGYRCHLCLVPVCGVLRHQFEIGACV